ncbi:MAG: nucleoside monophosphate kinase, partial [Nitrososphaerales archaeon]|nr:nucleoside monophosphate kinase [Nitrososphaerales archaeon]
GLKASIYIEKGQYVPDEIVNRIVSERLKQDDCNKGFILDGYPRTIEQVKFLENLLKEMNKPLDLVINIRVSESEIVRRLSSRRVCPKCNTIYNLIDKPPKKDELCDVCGSDLIQRDDDKPDVIRNRLRVYIKETEPLIDYYLKKGKVIEIDGEGPIDQVSQRIRRAIDDKLTHRFTF